MATSLNITWTSPTDTVTYFVWDNHDSSTAKQISARFLLEWTEPKNLQVIENKTLLPSQGIYYGIPCLLLALP
jgi:hypothetical protein